METKNVQSLARQTGGRRYTIRYCFVVDGDSGMDWTAIAGLVIGLIGIGISIAVATRSRQLSRPSVILGFGFPLEMMSCRRHLKATRKLLRKTPIRTIIFGASGKGKTRVVLPFSYYLENKGKLPATDLTIRFTYSADLLIERHFIVVGLGANAGLSSGAEGRLGKRTVAPDILTLCVRPIRAQRPSRGARGVHYLPRSVGGPKFVFANGATASARQADLVANLASRASCSSAV